MRQKGCEVLAKTIGIGNQDFEVIRREDYFYMDKTPFIKEWWEGGDSVTLITRPRRFGKTLTMSMVEAFFSVKYADRYILTSNRESGFGRYDVMLEPRSLKDDGIILEFKVQDKDEEKELTDTVQAALDQIDRQKYESVLAAKGVPEGKIRKYGFAFCGKKVVIGEKIKGG